MGMTLHNDLTYMYIGMTLHTVYMYIGMTLHMYIDLTYLRIGMTLHMFIQTTLHTCIYE